ncbi:hypothetical protein H0H93_001206, partial [Arthromyces matolae]
MPVLVGLEGASVDLVANDPTELSNSDGSGKGDDPSPGTFNDPVKGLTSLDKDNASVKTKRKYTRKVIPSADTGRPETGKEFAARMSKHFVLKGPQQRKEGEGSTQDKLTIKIPARKPKDALPKSNALTESSETTNKELERD